jgi:hypothetical protein
LFLVHDADSRVGDDAIKSIEIMGYDPERRCYFAPFFVVSDDGKTVRARHEKSDDGNNWTLWMDVTLTKQS